MSSYCVRICLLLSLAPTLLAAHGVGAQSASSEIVGEVYRVSGDAKIVRRVVPPPPPDKKPPLNRGQTPQKPKLEKPRAATQVTLPCRPLTSLRENDRIVLGATGSVRLLLQANGHLYTVQQSGEFHIQRENVTRNGQIVERVGIVGSDARKFARPPAFRATGLAGSLRGGRGIPLDHLSPMGVVRAAPDLLRWSEEAPLIERITLTEQKGSLLGKKVNLHLARHEYPVANLLKDPSKPLRDSQTYIWEIGAGSKGVQVAFRILTLQAREQLEQIEASLQPLTQEEATADIGNLLLAHAYVDYQMFEEAMARYGLVREHLPDSQELQTEMESARTHWQEYCGKSNKENRSASTAKAANTEGEAQ